MKKRAMPIRILTIVLLFAFTACLLSCVGGGGSDRSGGGIEGSGVRNFELEGSVLDSQSNPLPGVAVSIENDISGEAVSTRTDNAGKFSVTATLAIDEPALVVFDGFNSRTQIELPKESLRTDHVKVKVKLEKSNYEIEEVEVVPPKPAPTSVPEAQPTATPEAIPPPEVPTPVPTEVSSSQESVSESATASSSAEFSESSSSSSSSSAPSGPQGGISSLNNSADLGDGIPG